MKGRRRACTGVTSWARTGGFEIMRKALVTDRRIAEWLWDVLSRVVRRVAVARRGAGESRGPSTGFERSGRAVSVKPGHAVVEPVDEVGPLPASHGEMGAFGAVPESSPVSHAYSIRLMTSVAASPISWVAIAPDRLRTGRTGGVCPAALVATVRDFALIFSGPMTHGNGHRQDDEIAVSHAGRRAVEDMGFGEASSRCRWFVGRSVRQRWPGSARFQSRSREARE